MPWYDAFVHIDEDDSKNKNSKVPPPKVDTSIVSPPKDSGKTSFQKRFNPLPNVSTTETSVPAVTVTPNNSISPTTSETTSGPVFDKFLEHFDSLFDKSNYPSPNYYLYSKMLSEMGDLADTPRYRSAFAALKVQGLTKQGLIDSANQYINLLTTDEDSFKEAVNKNMGDNEAKTVDIKKTIQENTDAIEKIKNDTRIKIEQLEKDCDNQIALLEDSNQKNQEAIAPLEEQNQTIKQREEIYNNASKKYKNMIQSDIQKVQTIIQ